MEDCLIGEIIKIGGRRFVIEQEFWRTRTSFGQRLVPRSEIGEYGSRINFDMRFALGRHEEQTYWIKEWLVDRWHGGAVYEASEMTRLAGMRKKGRARIGPARLLVHDKSRLAMEYLANYVRLTDVRSLRRFGRVTSLLAWWLKKCEITAYDLSPNNTLVSFGRKTTIKLVDFGWSPQRDPGYWDRRLGSWVCRHRRTRRDLPDL